MHCDYSNFIYKQLRFRHKLCRQASMCHLNVVTINVVGAHTARASCCPEQVHGKADKGITVLACDILLSYLTHLQLRHLHVSVGKLSLLYTCGESFSTFYFGSICKLDS